MKTNVKYFRFANLVILWLALWLRLTDLYRFPLFGDEADHLYWAQEFSIHSLNYPLFMHGKFLMGVVVAQFYPWGPDPLWLARAVVGLFSLLSVTGCIYLGARLGGPRAGLLAGLLYALLPLAIFNERQMLADPLMAAFGTVAIAFTWRAASRREWWWAIGLAIALATALLTKFFGSLYWAYPALAGLLLARRGDRATTILRLVGAGTLAVILAGGYLYALGPRIGSFEDRSLANNEVGFVKCPALICEGSLAKQLEDFERARLILNETFDMYFGWPVALLALAALPLSPLRYRQRTTWFLLSAGATFLTWLSATRDFPPRYVFFIGAPIVVLAAAATTNGAHRVGSALRRAGAGTTVGLALVLLTLIPMANSAWLIASPRHAAMPWIDYAGFDGYFRAGFREAADYIEAHDTGELPPLVLADRKFDRSLEAYLDRARITVDRAAGADIEQAGGRLIQGQTIYFLDVIERDTAPAPWIQFSTVELVRFFHTDTLQVRLSRVVAADSTLREALFRRYFILPEELESNYADLVNALPAAQPLTLLVYPPNHAQVLGPLVAAGRPDARVVPIGDAWPIDEAAVNIALSPAVSESSDIRIVLLQETNGDPRRLIETWLNTHLYRIDEQWFGPVHLINLAGPGEVAQTVAANARFGDGIELEAIDILDSVSQPGGLIRLRLHWLARAPIPQQFKIFTHIFSGEAIIAQHDGQPVGELRPTNTWVAGEQVVDQFAIRLPAEAASGVYQFRIGMYDINSQARLPMLMPDGVTGEFFIGGSLMVK